MFQSQPANFSWFVENKLAGMGYPDRGGNISYLAAQGVKTLVNLTEGQCYSDSPATHGLTVHSIPIPDFHPPTVEQIEDFLRVADNANPKSVSQHLLHYTQTHARTRTYAEYNKCACAHAKIHRLWAYTAQRVVGGRAPC